MLCTATNILFKWPKQPHEKKHGEIYLTKDLSRDTGWAKCVQSGPDSLPKPGDELLLSKRVTTYTFTIDGEKMHNTSDASVLGYKHNGELLATCGTILYEWLEAPEEVTESGIVVIRNQTEKEIAIIRKAKVHAAGPESGVKAGDTILLAYNKDAYAIEYNGVTLHNATKEAVICYWSDK